MRRLWLFALRRILSVLVLAAPVALAASGEDRLDQGIRLVKDGDFEGALVTLDQLTRDLAGRSRPPTDLVTAYVWLGAAYAGLDQEALAAAKLEQALRLDPQLTLSAEEFPPKLLRLLEAARRKLAEEQRLEKQAAAKPRSKGLLLVGAGAAVAGGIALAISPSERANTPPTARITLSPEGKAISRVTQVTLTADASDREGDPLSYEWDLGDGVRVSGSPISHIFGATEFPEIETTFNIRLEVSDGLARTSATSSLVVGTLRGFWSLDRPTPNGVAQIDLRTGGSVIQLVPLLENGDPLPSGGGTIRHPRQVELNFPDCGLTSFVGEVGPDLNIMQGTYACGPGAPRDPRCRECQGQPLAVTLRR